MTDLDWSATPVKRRLKSPTHIECLVLAAIIVVLIALIIPQPKWASSGTIHTPVRVFVFDSVHSQPIPQAQVTVFRAPPLINPDSVNDDSDRLDPNPWNHRSKQYQGLTDARGTAVIDVEFRTGASHLNPITRAHLAGTWVRVDAQAFGSVVVPVRYESIATKKLREQGGLIVTIRLESK